MRRTMAARVRTFKLGEALARLGALVIARASAFVVVGVALVSTVLLLHGLGDGVLSVFDEGLHGTLARRMLAADKYLALVDEHGDYSMKTGFSKPPLLLWMTALSFHALGPSLFALRLPVALAMLALVVLAATAGRDFAPARDDRHVFGALFALFLVTSQAALELGRTSNIEVVFTAFAVAGLFAAARAHAASRRAAAWTIVTGIFLALAFMTKQVVVAVPLFALVVVELASLRSDGGRAVLLRLAVPLVVVVVVGGTWTLLAWRALGDDLVDVLWRFTVQDRLEGFGGDRHFRWLNRIADHLDLLAAPMPWPLGVVGVFHLAATRQRARSDGRIDESWLMVAMLVGSTLAFENAARSTLLWYVFSMLPPIAAGLAHLVVALGALARDGSRAPHAVVGGVGAAAALLVVDASLARLSSRLDAAVAVGAVLALVMVARAPIAWSARARATSVTALIVVVTVVGAWSHPSHESGPGVAESLMARAGAHGGVVVSVDERLLARESAKDLRLGTYFGARARIEPPPWERPSDALVRVDLVSWPEELLPRAGVTVARGPGGVVVAGDLSRPPYDEARVEALLDEGSLTFEAEHGVTQLPESLERHPASSGGARRVRAPDDDEKPPKGALTSGPWFPLAMGRYEARFQLAWRCGGFAWKEEIGHVEVRADGKKLAAQELTCGEGVDDEIEQTVVVPFALEDAGHIDLVVMYNRGVLAHDKTTVTRVEGP